MGKNTRKEQKLVRSNEMQDILSRPPHSLVTWGSTVIGAVILLIIVGCCFFKYPDKIVCEVTITKTEPPVWIVANTTGRLQDLFVDDGQRVKQGDVVAVVENPANTKDVLMLDGRLARLDVWDGKVPQISFEKLELGDIQSAYNIFIKAVINYRNVTTDNLYDEKIRAEEALLRPYTDFVGSASRQEHLNRQQHQLHERNYEREKNLFESGLTSQSEMEVAEQTLLGSSIAQEQTRTSLANAKIQVEQIRNAIAELKLQKEQEHRQVEADMLSALESLRNEIRQWKQRYALASPTDGILSYNQIWKTHQNINAGDKVFAVLNNEGSVPVGKARIPVAGSGKVSEGQRVNIQLDGYPYLEYGYLTGYVVSVSSMPDENMYTATIRIEGELQTSYGKLVRMNGDLSGTAEIITENMSIAERLFAPLKYILHRNM